MCLSIYFQNCSRKIYITKEKKLKIASSKNTFQKTILKNCFLKKYVVKIFLQNYFLKNRSLKIELAKTEN